MKTNKVGLIPISTLRHIAPGLRQVVLSALLALFLIPAAFAAGPDEWPDMGFYTPDDLVEPISNGMMMTESQALACRPVIQISLDQLGTAKVTPSMMLYILNYPENEYSVEIDGPLTDAVYCEQIGETLMASVRELPSGNTCMTQFTVEDKLPPMLTCLNDTIPCYVEISELDFLSFINVVADNCTPFDDLELIYSYTIYEFDCDPDNMAGRIDVVYTATDLSGLTSTCEKSIYLEKFPLDSVDFPADTMLSCVNPDYSPENVGEPTIDGVPVDHFCELISWSTETYIPLCSGEFKIARLWKVMDWCTGETRAVMQSILVKDTFPPDIVCPADLTIGTDPTFCYATYTFPDPAVSDVCSDDDQIVTLFKISGSPIYYEPGDQIELPPGDYTVTVKATDDCLTTGTCEYIITVIDDEPPVLVCNDYSTNLNNLGISILKAESAQFWASDNCGIDSISVRKMVDICGNPQDTIFGEEVTFCCAEAGTSVMVIFKAIDVHGNESVCMIEVEVKDATPPVALCRDICLYVDINGFATITPDSIDDGSYDNCGIVSREIDRDSFDCKDIGPGLNPHEVTLTLTDPSGNVSTCVGLVTVKDTLPPEAFCKDITVMLDSTGFAMIEWEDIDAGSIDNCEIVERDVTPNMFTCDDVGDTIMVNYVVVDWSGNRDSCIAKVFVIDNPPVVICKDVTLALDSMGMVIVKQEDIDDVMDDCGEVTVVIERDSFGCDDIGVNFVVLTVTDIFGNTASCEAEVTVIDTLLPICRAKDITVMLDEDGMYTILAEDIDDGSSDECGILSLAIMPATFTCDDIAGNPNQVVLTVTDNNGNMAECTANVTVVNDNPPECKTMDITVYVDESGKVAIADDAVNDGSSATCGVDSVTVEPNMFDCDNIGGNVVTQTVTDNSGNRETCTATVTVLDTIAPTCLTTDIDVYLDENGMASIQDDTVNNGSDDNCEVLSITITPKDFNCDDVGDVVVTQTVTDVNMNSSMCPATVTVHDTVAPTCLTKDITVDLDENGIATIPDTAVDNGSDDACGIADITLDKTMFDCTDEDSVIVTMTVTDVNGNISMCTAVVHISNTGGPMAVCEDITIYLDDSGMVSITPEDVNDGSEVNCGELMLEIDKMDFICSDLGGNPVTLTVMDEVGRTDSCVAIVTVLDTVAPVCLAKDVTVYLDDMGEASIVIGDVNNGSSDNCSVELSIDPSQFVCANIGVVVVTITAEDPSMNMSTCQSMVTVEDTIAPMCVAVDTIFIILPANGMASITPGDVDDGSTDNCGILSLQIDKSNFTCGDLGLNTVTLTVTDIAGNMSQCQTIVKVEDGMNFECNAMDIIRFLDQNGEVVIVPGDIDDGSGGGCSSNDLDLSLDRTMFNCDDIGDVIVTLTVTTDTDTSSCTATVTIIDNLAPQITCPPDMTVDCGTDLGDLSQFGTATQTDNCEVVDSSETQTPDFDDCGQGTVTRLFTATDQSGNTSSCMQVITVGSEPFSEGDIVWPAPSIDLPECSSTDPGDIPDSEPIVNIPDGSCAQISISFSDSTEMSCDQNPMTPCVVVFRTWTVFDSCDSDNAMFTFNQTITIVDGTGPVFTPIADVTVFAELVTCTADVMLVAMATDCEMPVMNITNDFNAGGADASGEYPFGTTTVTFTAEDECCNISTLVVDVIVEDPGNPTFACFKPIVCMPEEMELVFTAEEFIVFENPGGCSTLDDYHISFSNTNPFAADTLIGCGAANLVLRIDVWIYNASLVKIDSCRGDLEINDGDPDCPAQNCPNPNLTIGGNVFNEIGMNINRVPVIISESSMLPTETDGNGAYMFYGLSQGGSYALAPYNNSGPLEGVSTLDLVQIQKHLLGLKPLDSPYKRIAADVDANGRLTVLDMLELRKLLLGAIPEFTNNTSWRFVDAHFDFPDPYNPFMTEFPEEMIVDELAESKNDLDFVGVKTGDVNNTFTNFNEPDIDLDSPTELILTIQEQEFKAGELIKVPVHAANFDKLAGFQFGLAFDNSLVQYVDVDILSTSVMDETNFGLNKADDGVILVSWSTGAGVTRDQEEVLFTLRFRAKRNGSTSTLLNMSNETLEPQAYVDGDQISINSVDIFIVDPEQMPTGDDFALLQNRPNPFTDQTEIPFIVPEDGEVELLVHSIDGQLVFATKQSVAKGLQTITLDHKDLNAIGIYYYTIINDKYRATRKLTVLD